MAKNPILEAILEIIDEEISHMLREDKALDMSDDRREVFLKTVMSNPPADNSKGTLKEEGILPDKPVPDPTNTNAPPAGDSTPVDASPDMGAPMTAGLPAGSTSDMGAAIGQGGAGPTGAPGDGNLGSGDTGAAGAGGGAGSPEDATGGDTDIGGDSGGGMGGGGLGSGFGGGGGGGGDSGLGSDDSDAGGDSGPAQPEASYNPFKDAHSVEDKLSVIMDTAQGIADTTQDPQKVLKAVKGLIQNGFANPQQAAVAISQLFDTDNPVLQQVSRRLALFMDGI